jgi:tight adherence protein B
MIGILVVGGIAAFLVSLIRRDRVRARLVSPGLGAAPRRWHLAHERDALHGLVIGFALRGVVGAWVGAGAGIGFAEARRRRSEATRVHRIEAQVPELVRALAASLRVGGSVVDTFATIGEELPEPIATPIRGVGRRIATGATLDHALEDLRRDVPCASIERLVDAVRTADEVGGSLEELLGFIGDGIRDRLQLARERRAGTTQGRLSAIVVGGMPVAFLAITGMGASSPGRILFTEPVGWMLLAVGLSLEGLGFAWVRRIVRG